MKIDWWDFNEFINLVTSGIVGWNFFPDPDLDIFFFHHIPTSGRVGMFDWHHWFKKLFE